MRTYYVLAKGCGRDPSQMSRQGRLPRKNSKHQGPGSKPGREKRPCAWCELEQEEEKAMVPPSVLLREVGPWFLEHGGLTQLDTLSHSYPSPTPRFIPALPQAGFLSADKGIHPGHSAQRSQQPEPAGPAPRPSHLHSL